jgi:site-specific recombinase XerD
MHKQFTLPHIDLIERHYRRFLLQERGLIEPTVDQYLPAVRRFLFHRFRNRKIRLKKLCPRDVRDFVLYDSSDRGRSSLQTATSALRSFLGFLFQRGRIPLNLAMAVPAVAGWRSSKLPRFLETAHVARLLRSCDRRRKLGKRDYAILLLLARLGLRAGEVVQLCLEDINWDSAELQVRGKGAHVDRLPLLQDVGQAIADYLQRARPSCSSRRVFVRVNPPYVGFADSCAVSSMVRRGLARARLQPPHQGAHLLRHSLATGMLRGGASLSEIAQVLRHREAQSAEVYAKVDLIALRALAQPWCGGAR